MDTTVSLHPVRMVAFYTNRPFPTEREMLGESVEQILGVAPPDAYAYTTFTVLRGRVEIDGEVLEVTTQRFGTSKLHYIGGMVIEDRRLLRPEDPSDGGYVLSRGSRLVRTRYGLKELKPDEVVVGAQ